MTPRPTLGGVVPHPASSTAGPVAGDWLVVAGMHHLNRAAPATDSDVWVLAPLPDLRGGAEGSRGWADNTILLRWADLGPLDLYPVRRDGVPGARATTTGGDLFDRLLPGATLDALVGDRGADAAPVPLFVLRTRPDGATGRLSAHVYAQIRFLAEDGLFIRITDEPLSVGGVTGLEWVPVALDRHAAYRLFLNNHQLYYRVCFAGRELEIKFTIDPPSADIWALTALAHRAIAGGELPGCLPEYRDEIQLWEFDNYLYEVVEPESERGYVSFIPTTDGRYRVKRKWFTADTYDRRETHTHGVTAPHGFEAYLRDELGLGTVPLPPFHRVRYDLNVESIRTGHVYGIMFDTVSLIGTPGIRLQQCEMEYLRSRAVAPDEDAIAVEMAEIATWVEGFLEAQGYPAARGYYSKLSWLRDVVAARG
ncbi:MAG TPA: hypothetical protein VF054_09990 [Micromonosporaceae bacterium]